MIKIKEIEIQALENAGCNNGNYPEVRVTFDNATGGAVIPSV